MAWVILHRAIPRPWDHAGAGPRLPGRHCVARLGLATHRTLSGLLSAATSSTLHFRRSHLQNRPTQIPQRHPHLSRPHLYPNRLNLHLRRRPAVAWQGAASA